METEPERPDRSVSIELSPGEFELARNGLRMLEDSFGHEEADELEAVQALLRKLDAAAGSSMDASGR